MGLPDHPQRCDDIAPVMQCRDVELRLWDPFLDRIPLPDGSDHCIYLVKTPEFLTQLVEIFDRRPPRRIIEIGVKQGGSVIFWMERYNPDRVAAIEIEAAPLLTRYLQRHGLADRVRTYFGISQDDRPALIDIAKGFDRHSVDLVIDDASHRYAETRSSVETLLPFVAPGGIYVIEDWNWGHASGWPPGLWADRPLLSPLIAELMLICGHRCGAIDKVEVNPWFVTLYRGALDLPQDGSFRLTDHYLTRSPGL